jgi:parallel beta-helix repeat protein
VQLDSGANGTVVAGNFIGTDSTGKVALANSVGVSIAGSNNTVGGVASGAGNTIADNSSGGILVSAGSGNSLRQNAVFSNGPSRTGPGITLSAGANNNLVAPSLSAATLNGSTLTVQGTFTASILNVSYVLEFFANVPGDAEGAIYLGAKTVKAASTSTVSFSFTTTTTVTGTDPVITATITDPFGDTSAFSNGMTS